MEIAGLPLHPLVIHAVVVLGPAASLLALAYLVPAWRDRLRWPLLGLVLVVAGAAVLAYLSGLDLREQRYADAVDDFAEQLDVHQAQGTFLMIWSLGFAGLTVLATSLHRKEGWLRWLLNGLLAVVALVVLLLVVLAGDSGARSVWG
jgi:predicted membrane protein